MRTNQTPNPKKSIRNFLPLLLIWFMVAITLGPLLWVAGISFKTTREFSARPFALPEKLDFSSYVQVLTDGRMLHFIENSIVVTFWAILIVLVASVLAGYALARIPFRGSNFLFILFILSDAIPIFVVIIPLFFLLLKTGLSGTRWGLILPYSAMKIGLSVFIMRGFFRSVSSEMEDAARLDGAATLRMIWSIMLPMVRPGVLVVVILNFISFWNEYFLAAVLLPSQDLYTLPAGLAAIFVGKYSTNWPLLSAGLVISILPTLLLFSFAQGKIIEGWTVTVK
jgi:ABC-type glycerol-3-phosphate transport system permease component